MNREGAEEQRNIRMEVLDQYLLHRDISRDVLNEFLDLVGRSRWARHMAEVGLADGMPDLEGDNVDSLFRLRIGFVHPVEPSAPVFGRLRMACEVCSLLSRFTRDGGRVSELENQLEACYSYNPSSDQQHAAIPYADEVDIILTNLRLCIAMVGAPSEDVGASYVDVVNECMMTMKRIESYWRSVLYCERLVIK